MSLNNLSGFFGNLFTYSHHIYWAQIEIALEITMNEFQNLALVIIIRDL